GGQVQGPAEVDGPAPQVPGQVGRARGVRRARTVRPGAEGSLMLALSIEPAQILVGVAVGIVAFLLAWFLLGTAARSKQDRDRAARKGAAIHPRQEAGQAVSDTCH